MITDGIQKGRLNQSPPKPKAAEEQGRKCLVLSDHLLTLTHFQWVNHVYTASYLPHTHSQTLSSELK